MFLRLRLWFLLRRWERVANYHGPQYNKQARAVVFSQAVSELRTASTHAEIVRLADIYRCVARRLDFAETCVPWFNLKMRYVAASNAAREIATTLGRF